MYSIFQHFKDSTSPDNSVLSEQLNLPAAPVQSGQPQMLSASAATQLEKDEPVPLLELEVAAPAAPAPAAGVRHDSGCYERRYSTVSEEDSQHCVATMAELRKIFGEEAYKSTPGGEEGIICYCGNTECLIEFNLYKYKEPETPVV